MLEISCIGSLLLFLVLSVLSDFAVASLRRKALGALFALNCVLASVLCLYLAMRLARSYPVVVFSLCILEAVW